MNGTMQTGTVNVVKLTKEDLQKAVNKLSSASRYDENIRLKQQEENTKIALENLRQQNEILDIPKVEEKEEILTLKFTVRATKSKLKALKQYLIDGGYDYE